MLYSENIEINKKGIKFTDKDGRELSLPAAASKAQERAVSWVKDLILFKVNFVSLHVPFHSIRKAVFRLFGVKIGKGSTIHMGCKFFEPKNVQIGKDTIIGSNAFLDGRDSLIIGDHVNIASEVMVYNSEHDINDEFFKPIHEPVTIKDYVFIGPRAIILPGVVLGKGSVVAAGAVVTKNIDDFKIVGGVPAVVIGDRSFKNPKYRIGRARLFQ